MGISPDNKMVATQALLWRLDLGSLEEVALNGQQKVDIVPYDDSVVRDVIIDEAAKKVTFATSAIGTLQIATSGKQAWAWAYGASGFTYHGTNKGVSSLNFNLDRDLSSLPAPTPPPIFNANSPPCNSNDGAGCGSATAAITKAFSANGNAGMTAIIIVASLVGPFLTIALIVAAAIAILHILKVKRDLAVNVPNPFGPTKGSNVVTVDLSIEEEKAIAEGGGESDGVTVDLSLDLQSAAPPLPQRSKMQFVQRNRLDDINEFVAHVETAAAAPGVEAFVPAIDVNAQQTQRATRVQRVVQGKPVIDRLSRALSMSFKRPKSRSRSPRRCSPRNNNSPLADSPREMQEVVEVRPGGEGDELEVGLPMGPLEGGEYLF